MLEILVNAYACGPEIGSEPGMAWNWCINLANHCKLHIITEGEFRDKIEAALPNYPQSKNMTFYYNPVSDKIRKMCWNQGNWLFYRHYKKWQYKTYLIASEIVKKEPIAILHQLNMVGFREPGYLWKINHLPFVWGPVGGFIHFPEKYLQNLPFKTKQFIKLKNRLNHIQAKYSSRIQTAAKEADILIGATQDSMKAFDKYFHKKGILISETGCYLNSDFNENTDRFTNTTDFNILWVGRLDFFGKQLPLAIKIIEKVKHLQGLHFHIIGDGNQEYTEEQKHLTRQLGIENICTWHGKIPHQQVQTLMKQGQLFLFTSLSEATSSVTLEALQNQLPVLCFNACGQGNVIDDSTGRKVEISNPQKSISDFAQQITFLYNNRDVLLNCSKNCRNKAVELSWENKAKLMVELYSAELVKFNNKNQN